MLLGQQADITGWSKVRFGMTMSQIKAAFGKALTEKTDKKTKATYAEMNTTIADLPFVVEFQFSGPKITSIALTGMRPQMRNGRHG